MAGVFKSADEGVTWRQLAFPSQGRPGVAVVAGPAISVGAGLLFIGALDDGIWLSRDSGTNWTSTGPVTSSFGTGAAYIGYNGTDFVAGYGGWPRGIYRWNGASWDKTDSGYDGNDGQIGLNGRFWVNRWNGGVVSSDDGGRTWQSRLAQASLLTVEGTTVYALDQSSRQLRVSTDNGGTWTDVGSPIAATGSVGRLIRWQGAMFTGVHGSGLWTSAGDLDWQQVSTNSETVIPFVIDSRAYICTDDGLLVLNGAANARTATAVAQVVNGFVVGATVSDGGAGYTNVPVVTITGGNGSGATAKATVINGSVTAITILTPGSGYTETPQIVIAPPPFPPRRAVAAATVVNGFVVSAEISDGGFGYSGTPAVRITGGGGSGATAIAVVENGVVTGVAITNPGSGYTGTPKVSIASPLFSPELKVAVSRVTVTSKVVLGLKYLLESSADLQTWSTVGNPFVAESEELNQEYVVGETGQFFRITQVP